MHQDRIGQTVGDSVSRSAIIEREPVRRSLEDTTHVERSPSAVSPDLVPATTHWRSTLAGTLTAFTALLLMGLLGLAIGLTQFNAATAATQGALPAALGRDIGMWGAFSLLIAFLAGGYVAARSYAANRPEHGAWRGALVFLLASPLLLWLILGGLVGSAGALAGTIGGLHVDPSTQARINPTAVGDLAGHLRDATWWMLFGCFLGLAGGALGGVLATRRDGLRTARSGRPSHERVHRDEVVYSAESHRS